MEVQKSDLKLGSSPGNFSNTMNVTAPENIFDLCGNEQNLNINDYLENKGINPDTVSQDVKNLMKYLTADSGCVSAGVQIFGYDTAQKALDILGFNLKPKSEYLG